jgi:hypothetical protein
MLFAGRGYFCAAVAVNGFGFFSAQAVLVCFWFLFLRWHPRFVSLLQASPLCGAAPTFLCRRKEK